MAVSDSQRLVLLDVSRPILEKVYPPLAKKAELLINALADSGLSFGAHIGLRSFEWQAALYAQGRELIEEVNRLRKLAGFAPIRQDQNTEVTKKKIGYHNFALAVDLVEDGIPDNAGIQWSWKSNVNYLKIGRFAVDLGLEWGGFWKSFKDYPHVQLTGGLSVNDCIVLYSKGGLPCVWEAVDKRLGSSERR